jgi:hypothetical protein
MLRILILLFISLHLSLIGKIRLLTFHYNQPESVELQQRAFNQFMLDDFELIIFNDTNPAELEYPNMHHNHVVQYALDHFGYEHDDIVAILDCDFLPIRPISFRELLKDAQIIGIHSETGPNYFSPPFVAFNPKTLPDIKTLKIGASLTSELIPGVKIKNFYKKNSTELWNFPVAQLANFGFNVWEIKLMKAFSFKYTNLEFHVNNHFMCLTTGSFCSPKMKTKLQFINLLINSFPDNSFIRESDLYGIYEYYSSLTPKYCDIGEHLPELRRLALECPAVIEIGLGPIVSTWGIIQGLSENTAPYRSYLGIDIDQPPISRLNLVSEEATKHGISFRFLKENDLNINIEPADLLFIDSMHTYCHLTYELNTFSPKIRKYIALHDTSEPWGDCDDVAYAGDYSEYPASYNRKKRGLWPAVEDFLRLHPEWVLQSRLFNCHGFTVLKRSSFAISGDVPE